MDRCQAYHEFSEFLSGIAKEPFKETSAIMDMLDELKTSL